MPPKIAIENYTASFHRQPTLRNLNLEIFAHERLAIIGPAGSGKSTLLRSLNRLNEQVPHFSQSGRILLDGEDVLGPKTDLANLRHRLGFIPAFATPLPESIYENVTFALKLAGLRDKSRLDEAVKTNLDEVELWEVVKDRLWEPALRLHTGEQYQLCLARILALQPDVLLLDEPCTGLDPIFAARIEALLFRLKERYTIVLATHDNKQAARASDRTALLIKGEIVECGSTAQIFHHPAQDRTSDYVRERFNTVS